MDIVTKVEDITLLSVVLIMGTAVNPHAETETTAVDTMVMTASQGPREWPNSKYRYIHLSCVNCYLLLSFVRDSSFPDKPKSINTSALALYCDHSRISGQGTNADLRWSWKTYGSSEWRGTAWKGRDTGYCHKTFQSYFLAQTRLYFKEQGPVESFRIETLGTDGLFLDELAFKRVNSFWEGSDETVRHYGVDGGLGWCLSRNSNTPFGSYCGGNRAFYCLEFRSNGGVYNCEGDKCNLPEDPDFAVSRGQLKRVNNPNYDYTCSWGIGLKKPM